MINRRFVRQFRGGNVGHNLAVILHHHTPGVGDKAYFRPWQIPLVKNPFHIFFAALVDDEKHPLLRFAEHDFVRGHVRRAPGNFAQINLDARARPRRRFAGGTGQSRGAHVLNARDGAGGEQFEAGLQHEFFHEWIADLHRAALVFGRCFGQILRGKRRAGQPIASRRRSDVEHGIANSFGGAARDLVVAQHAQAKRVHQRVCFVARVEIDLAADGRDAEAVAVMGDAGDDACEEAAVVCDLRFPIRGF